MFANSIHACLCTKNMEDSHQSFFGFNKNIKFALFNNKTLQVMAYVINNECTACGTCLPECPSEAISEGDIYVIDPDLCTDCAACADVCPVEAIHPA